MEAYTYPLLLERHIRLLTIDHLRDPPSGSLETFSLDEVPEFYALSYAWGDPGNELPFICSENSLSVRQNLGSFLQLVRSRSLPRPIWIDAICIDQKDDAEKNRQIPLMGEIYSKAAQVLVWLGTTSSGREEDFLASIPLVARTLKDAVYDQNSLDLDPLVLKVLPPHGQLLTDIGDMLSQPWFCRLWAMQEVLKNRKVTVLYGEGTIKWQHIVSLALGLIKHNFHAVQLARVGTLRSVHAGYGSLIWLTKLIRAEFDDPQSFQDLLISIRIRQSTRGVDKVLGALAVMPPHLQQELVVDLCRSQEELYARFARGLLNLGAASAVLRDTSHSIEMRDLPSWCPDLSKEPTESLFGNMYSPFSAGHEIIASEKKQIKLLQAWNRIEVEGFEVDVVSDTVSGTFAVKDGMQDVKAILAWDAACLDMSQKYFEASEFAFMMEKLCGARIAQGHFVKRGSRWGCPSEWMMGYMNWQAFLQFGPDLGFNLNIHGDRFLRSLWIASRNRRVFISKGKSIGLGPLSTQPGDLICILYGLSTPFILRQNPDNITYRLIGEAFVNDIMDGEAFELQRERLIPDKKYILE